MEANNNAQLLSHLLGLTRETLMTIVKNDLIAGKGVPVKSLAKWRKGELVCLITEFLTLEYIQERYP